MEKQLEHEQHIIFPSNFYMLYKFLVVLGIQRICCRWIALEWNILGNEANPVCEIDKHSPFPPYNGSDP